MGDLDRLHIESNGSPTFAQKVVCKPEVVQRLFLVMPIA